MWRSAIGMTWAQVGWVLLAIILLVLFCVLHVFPDLLSLILAKARPNASELSRRRIVAGVTGLVCVAILTVSWLIVPRKAPYVLSLIGGSIIGLGMLAVGFYRLYRR